MVSLNPNLFIMGFWTVVTAVETNQPKSPIILLPGMTKSRLEADLNKETRKNILCHKHGRHQIWPPAEELLPGLFSCWVDNIRLFVNNETGQVYDPPGITVTVPGFGTTEEVEYLMDMKRFPLSKYFATLVKHMVKNWKYERNTSIRAAPFDFRKTTEVFLEKDYFPELKQLIEETARINGDTPVTLLCHSHGSIVAQFFLQLQKKEWKQKFIKRFISIGGPYGGSTWATLALVSGVKPVSIVPRAETKEIQRSWACFHQLLPISQTEAGDFAVIITPTKNYTTSQVQELYKDIMPDYWNLYLASNKKYNPLVGPGVEVHCIVGTNVSTTATLIYGSRRHKFPEDGPKIEYQDGDATVLASSANLCKRWSENQKEPVLYKAFPKANHVGMLSDKRVLQYLDSVVGTDTVLKHDEEQIEYELDKSVTFLSDNVSANNADSDA